MTSSRRAFLKRFGMGTLVTGSLMATGIRAEAQGTCRRISGAGSYLLSHSLVAKLDVQPRQEQARFAFIGFQNLMKCTDWLAQLAKRALELRLVDSAVTWLQ